jgi:hypothetical protein
MRARILALTALILALGSSVIAAQTLPAYLKNAPAATVIGRILAGRDQLALSAEQVARLTVLENQLKHDRGRTVVTGLDQVPGKSVPRVERVKATAAEAFRQASALLSTEQQAKASRLLGAGSR